MTESVTLKDGDDELTMEIDMFSAEERLDMDRLLRIDYSLVPHEVANFPSVVAKLNIAAAREEAKVRETQLNLDIYEAQLREQTRQKLTVVGERGGVREPTGTQLNDIVTVDPQYKALKKLLFNAMKRRDYLSALFWAAKAKQEQLQRISANINLGDASAMSFKQYLKSLNSL